MIDSVLVDIGDDDDVGRKISKIIGTVMKNPLIEISFVCIVDIVVFVIFDFLLFRMFGLVSKYVLLI